MNDLTPEQIIEILELEPLPVEGGFYRVTYADENHSNIYFLTFGEEFSAMHVLTVAETWNWYAGAPLRLVLGYEDGRVEEIVMGPDIAAGQRPQHVVPAGVWMGADSAGEWTLLGTSTSPKFTEDAVTFGSCAELSEKFPSAAARMAELTRF